MKRIAFIFALVLALAVPSFATSNPERLSQKQLDSLIAGASTPAEHQRIADYYRAESARLLAEASAPAQMAAAFRANPVTNNEKTARGTVNHCEYVANTLRTKSAKARALAENHERMAHAASLASTNPPAE